jgi:hypothetical protein
LEDKKRSRHTGRNLRVKKSRVVTRVISGIGNLEFCALAKVTGTLCLLLCGAKEEGGLGTGEVGGGWRGSGTAGIGGEAVRGRDTALQSPRVIYAGSRRPEPWYETAPGSGRSAAR